MSQPTEGVCYLDTSALTKFYVKEPGSRKLEKWFGPRVAGFTPALPLYTSWLGYPEAMSAVTRKRNVGALPPGRVVGVWREIMIDFITLPLYLIVEPTETVVARASMMVVKHGLRAYDAMHLASAITLQYDIGLTATLTFITCDIRLKHAAIAENLIVADPTM
jgi:predicted nucleic acid-binding protein